MKEEELDLIRRAHQKLVELEKGAKEGPWAARSGEEAYSVEAPRSTPITWDDHGGQVFDREDAELIAALRGCVPFIIFRFEAMLSNYLPHQMSSAIGFEINLAKAILGEK